MATDRLSHFHADAVDLAVRHGRPPFGAGLHAELLFEDVLVAVASPSLIDKLGRPDKSGRLIRHVLLHDAHNVWPQFIEQALPQVSLSPAKNIRFNQTSLAIDAAVAGQGLALAHLAFVEPDILARRLIRVFQSELRTGAGFYIVFPRRRRFPGPVADVHRWLLRQVKIAGQI